MNILLSPYLLTTREAPAMAALLLGERVVTLRPAPQRYAGASDLRDAARTSPSFLGLMESWRWSMPLWTGGVVVPAWTGADPAAAVAMAAAEIEDDEQLAPLHAFMHAGLFERPDEFLERIARDILKGGPDPGLTIPVHAGLDAFAASRGLVVARASASSLAQRAEEQLMEPLSRVVVPVLTQASAEALIAAREILGPRLASLRTAMLQGGGALADAAGSYARAFDGALASIRSATPDDDVRVTHGAASLSLVRMPRGAVVHSSLTAAGGRRPRPVPLATDRARAIGAASSRPGAEAAALAPPARREASEVLALVVRVLGRASP